MPDLIIVLDIPMVTQDFIDAVHLPVLWMDHHTPQERRKVVYINPRKYGESVPTSYLAYLVSKEHMWIATIGSIFDWHIPDFLPEFKKKYPGFLKAEKEPGKILFKTKLGKLIRVFCFMIKGKPDEVKKVTDAIFKVENPNEIVDKTSEAGKIIASHAERLEKEYEELLKTAKKELSKDKLFVFVYPSQRTSFTTDLANELTFLHPDKVTVIGREKSGEVKMSIRSGKVNIQELLKKALVNVKGYGGGHEYACGACVKKDDFDVFIDNMRKEL